MSATDKIIANVQPHLQPGEQVHGAFAGQTSIRFQIPFDRYHSVVATDRRILVFDSGTLRQTKTDKLIAELPRSTPLGPVEAMLWHPLELTDKKIYVNRRFFKHLAAIESAAA